MAITFKSDIVLGMRCAGCAIALDRSLSELAGQFGDTDMPPGDNHVLALCEDCSPLSGLVTEAGMVVWSDVMLDSVLPFREWEANDGAEATDEQADAEFLRLYRAALKVYEDQRH